MSIAPATHSIDSSYDALPAHSFASVAVTSNRYVPATTGIPDSKPLAESDNPGGAGDENEKR